MMGSCPTEDLIDRLCSPAPPECKLGTLARREPEVDEKMGVLLREMEVRNRMAIETGRKLEALHSELTFVIDILEHDEKAREYELAVEKQNRRSLCCWLTVAGFVFLFTVFVLPSIVVFLP